MADTALRVTRGEGPPQLFIYDEIGPGWLGLIDDVAVLDALDDIGETEEIVVRLNSPGGDVFIGNSIANAFRRFDARIVMEIDSLAASIASVIAMSGDDIRIADNAMMMVHESWTFALGNKRELADVVGRLGKVDGLILDAYVNRTGQPRADLEKLIEAETWMTAQEAIDLGFADKLISSTDTAAAIPEHLKFRNIPDRLAAAVYRRKFMKRRGRGFPDRDSQSYPNIADVLQRRQERT